MPFLANRDDGSTQYPCKRADNVDLIDTWKRDKVKRNLTHHYVQTRDELNAVDLQTTDHVLGSQSFIS